jgi:NADH:ubiquinone oxidoreductase subunit 6 (subunit J)
MNWHSLYFLLFASIACFFALAVVFTANVVRMAFYLIISLAATAGLFFLAGADFVGAMQLVLYVGGTLVLLVFGVMLTAQSPFISIKTGGGDWILAAIVGGSFLAVLISVALQLSKPHEDVSKNVAESGEETAEEAELTEPPSEPTAARIGLALLGAPADGKETGSGYLLPFEIISIHLLVVLVGAAYLARPKRRAKPEESAE